jgi:uncharacterized protein YjbI with pentapeptide repeats
MSSFEETKLTRADLAGADLSSARFEGATAQQTRFVNCRLPYADFSHARLELADFKGADLSGAILHAVIEDGAKWSRAKTKGVQRTDLELLEAETWKPPAE